EVARAFFEPRFGANFSQVRVHTDTQAARTASSINAKAFTIGRDIAFAAGQYAPHSGEGQRLLAHELTHVVQQSVGVAPGAAIERKEGFAGAPPITPARSVVHRKEKKTNWVPYKIHVTEPLTPDQFKAVAMRQVFGAVVQNVEWKNSKDTYVPENSPYPLLVSTDLLRRVRGQASEG